MFNHLKLYNSISILCISIILTTNCFLFKESLDDQLKKYNIYSKNDLTNESNIPFLIKALNDENPYVVSTAITALGDLKHEEAIPLIINKLGDKSLAIRINSILALEKIGVANDSVIEALNFRKTFESNERVRKYIYNALSTLNYERNVQTEEQTKSSQKQVIITNREYHLRNIAISNIELIKIHNVESSTITNRLYSELFKSRQFVILERQKMEEILKEQGFQQTGCTTNECLVEMGKLLNVRLMVGGSVTKVNRLHSIDLRIIDVQSGEVVSVSTEDVMGSIEDVLLTGLKNSIVKLINNFSQ